MWTWNEYYRDAMSFSKALSVIGVEDKTAINIMGFNAPEWVICCFGAIMNNMVVSGVYTTNGEDACQYQAFHSEAQIIAVDTIE